MTQALRMHALPLFNLRSSDAGFVSEEYNFLEFYAGKARTTAAFRECGEKCAKFDILYHDPAGTSHKTNYMDLTTASGFLLLAMPFNSIPMQSCRVST